MKRFRLRTLFLLVTALALCCATVSWLDIFGPTGEIFRLKRISYKDTSSVAYATRKLHSKDHRVRREAILALGRIGPSATSSMAELLKILAVDSPAEAPNAAWAIGHIGMTSPAIAPELRNALKSKDAETRRYAAYAVSLHLGGTAPIPELIALLDDDRAAYVAARALGKAGPAGAVAVPNLTLLLSPDNAANAEAAIALSELSVFAPLPSDTMDKLNSLTSHREEYVRRAANEALTTTQSYWAKETR